MDAATICHQASWIGSMALQPTAIAPSKPPKYKPTTAALKATVNWWHGHGWDVRPLEARRDHVVVDLSADVRIHDDGMAMTVQGAMTDDALRYVVLRGMEWGGLSIGGGWDQVDIDRLHIAAQRVGFRVDYGVHKPSTAVIAATDAGQSEKLTARQDVRDGIELKRYLDGEHIDDEELRAFGNYYPETAFDMLHMLPLQLAATARMARIEGRSLLAENPDAGASLKRVREVGGNRSDPVAMIPSGQQGG